MIPDMAIIIPSRGRPEAMVEMYEAWQDTSEGYAAPFSMVDNDNPKRPESGGFPGHPGHRFRRPLQPRLDGRGAELRRARSHQGWLRQHHPVNFVGFMGDDHRPRTEGWDRIYSAHLRQLVSQRGAGIVYGDDTIQHEKLPTQVAMSANVITAIGYMAPPSRAHATSKRAGIAAGWSWPETTCAWRTSSSASGPTVSDLGCGDGGLLSILNPHIDAWGYDFQPSNVAGWIERGVKAQALNVVTAGSLNLSVMLGHITVMTEVLEHMTNPHGILKEIGERKPGSWLPAPPGQRSRTLTTRATRGRGTWLDTQR